MEDNITRQAEEVEALCSIYGDQWQSEDECSQAYSICIKEGSDSVTLYVTLPPDYPAKAPPTYQVSAPTLSRLDKLELAGKLEAIYIDNIGENILYQWVEAVKDYLQQRLEKKGSQDVLCPDNDGEFETAFAALTTEGTKNEVIPYVTHGETITDRKSIFQGHVAVVASVDEVKLVLLSLMQNKKIANATHNIYAYRLQKEGCVVQDCEDDGETAAGGRLLHLLQIMDVMNVLVVVTRWYGGVHLGPDRFRHINNAARQALQLSDVSSKKK